MKIHFQDRVYENHCSGCLCHELPVIFGQDVNVCEECGCPKTPAGFEMLTRGAGDDGGREQESTGRPDVALHGVRSEK